MSEAKQQKQSKKSNAPALGKWNQCSLGALCAPEKLWLPWVHGTSQGHPRTGLGAPRVWELALPWHGWHWVLVKVLPSQTPLWFPGLHLFLARPDELCATLLCGISGIAWGRTLTTVVVSKEPKRSSLIQTLGCAGMNLYSWYLCFHCHRCFKVYSSWRDS